MRKKLVIGIVIAVESSLVAVCELLCDRFYFVHDIFKGLALGDSRYKLVYGIDLVFQLTELAFKLGIFRFKGSHSRKQRL